MVHGIVAVALACALLAGAAPAQDGKKKKEAGARPAAEVVEGAVGKALDEAMAEVDKGDGGFCGVVAVASKGKVLLQKGYGVADAEAKKAMPPDALFDWASVSKQFTAAAVLKAVELSALDEAKLKKAASKKLADALKKWKKLSLDDPLSRFFPDAPKDKAAVTLRQLLNHTSGIEKGFKQEWSFDATKGESLIELVLTLPMTSAPGKKFEYSNSGYSFVAALLEKLTGVTFEEFCAEQLFAPAGMKDATMIGCQGLPLERVPKIARGAGFTGRQAGFAFAYGNKMTWGYRGCGGIVASTADMVAWDRALRDGKLFSKASLDALYDPALDDYALGWEVKKVKGGTRVEHSGGVQGVVTWYMRHLDLDYVVALACSYEPKSHPSQIAEKLAKIVNDAK